MNNMKSLIEISKKYGSKPEFVLGGGGNTSFKNENILTVKASGFSLGTIDEHGFVKLELKKALTILEKPLSDSPSLREKQILDELQNARVPGETLRPSVETLLHALFPYTYVVHTHPSIINGLGCSNQGERIVRELFGNSITWLPYTTPGYILSKTVFDLFSHYKTSGYALPNIVILQNHGIFVAADTPAEIDGLYETVISAITKRVSNNPDMTPVTIDPVEAAKIIASIKDFFPNHTIRHANTRAGSAFLQDHESFKALAEPFTPDHIVYSGAKPLFITKQKALHSDSLKNAIQKFIEREEFEPKVIAVEKTGFFSLGDTSEKADLSLALFLDAVKIATLAMQFGGCHHMEKADIDFIKNWEAEHYRAKVSDETKRIQV